jgi:type I restriction enzyme S subunit
VFLLFWASAAHDDILSRANGSTSLEISKSTFRSLPVICPPSSVLAAFKSAVMPLYRRITGNVVESRSLSALRDTLLPRLISGELRVRDAERFLEQVL